MKKTYEKPFLKLQNNITTNPLGNVSTHTFIDNVEGIRVKDLIKEFGSPLFVYLERKIYEKYEEMASAFSSYPNVQHAWSLKTNYLKAICKTIFNLGSWAEVVSDMEYEMATSLGIEPPKIIFNGPYKPHNVLKKALLNRSIVNIDSLDELYEIEKISEETNKKLNIGIRVNMSLGTYNSWDRFGFNIDSGYAYQVVKRISDQGKLNLNCISAHIGTFILEPALYRLEVEKLIEFSKTIKNTFGIKLKYIDVGGGIASQNKLRSVYLNSTPGFDLFSEAILEPLLGDIDELSNPLLIHETGRALIDEAGILIATVCATKRLPNNLRAIVLDAGVNLLFTTYWYDHEIIPAVDRGNFYEDHVIYGPLCMQIDVVRPYVSLPPLEKGDEVIIRPVGAYNNTQWMQFIQLRPNIIMISRTGDVSVIREAETLEYLQSKENLPQWLTD